MLGRKDLEAGFHSAVVASSVGELDGRLEDEELRVWRDFHVFARLEFGRWLLEDVGGVFGEGAVSLTYDLLMEGGELDGACAVVAGCDQPRRLFVHKAVVDNIRDGAPAELASSEKRTVPALLAFREVGLAIVVVGQPNVR